MLKYFPSPYPGEWWYSVLCRYHVRSGNGKFQTTVKELFPGRTTAAIASVFPNSTIRQLVDNLPSEILQTRQIITNNTLFPYYTRFYTPEKKASTLEQLCLGKTVVVTNLRKFAMKWSPRYCPICAEEDRSAFGEAYWHIDHQIPLMFFCPKHGCPLFSFKEITITHLDYTFYSLESALSLFEATAVSDDSLPESRLPFLRILAEYQTLPLEMGAVTGCNNLGMTLFNMGYGAIQNRSMNITLDAKRLYYDLVDAYTREFVELVLGGKDSTYIINHICKWSVYSPERYALLQDFAGISSAVVFDSTPIQNCYEEKLLYLQQTGKVYTKKQVQEYLNITISQLDILTRRFHIDPFWKQSGDGTPTHKIVVALNDKEFDLFKSALKQSGYRYSRHFAKKCVMDYVTRNIVHDDEA